MVEIVHPDSNALLKKLMFQGKFTPYLDKLYAHHPESYRHSARVAQLSNTIVQLNRIPYPDLPFLIKVGLMHDIGKTYIPLEILDSTDPLETIRKKLQSHVHLGFKLLQELKEDRVGRAVVAVHEFQPDGYPRNHVNRVKARDPHLDRRVPDQELLAAAEIIAVVDMYDALTSNRAYPQHDFQGDVRTTLQAQFKGNPAYIDQILELGYNPTNGQKR